MEKSEAEAPLPGNWSQVMETIPPRHGTGHDGSGVRGQCQAKVSECCVRDRVTCSTQSQLMLTKPYRASTFITPLREAGNWGTERVRDSLKATARVSQEPGCVSGHWTLEPIVGARVVSPGA